MKRLRRRTAVAGVALVGVLAGCGGATRPGAAAIVGDERITVDTLRELTARSLADQTAAQRFGEDQPAFIRRELGVLIRRELLEQLAAELDVEVSPGQVDERLRAFSDQAGGRAELEKQAAAAGVAPSDLPDAVRDLVLEQAVGDALVAGEQVDPAALRAAYQQQADQFDQVRSAHILVANQAQANRLLAQVRADPGSFAELAAENSADTANKDRGGDLGFAGRGQFVKPFSDAVFAARPGEPFVVRTEFGFHVVRVIERRTKTLEQATPELRRAILGEQVQELIVTALTKAAREHDVKVSPRYGRYDAKRGEVIPHDDGLSRPPGRPQPTPTESASPVGP